MEQHASSVASCGKISLTVRQIVSILVHDVLKVDNSALCSWLCPVLLCVLGCCLCPEFMALCQVVASILRCYPSSVFLRVSWIYGTVPGCCLYSALLPVLCIFACVLNLWHCVRLLPLSCVVSQALYFCMCPEFMALCQVDASILRCYQCCVFLRVSWIYGTVPGCCLYPTLLPMLCIFACVLWSCLCPMLPLSWAVKRVLSPTALYKPGVKLNMEEGARIVQPLQTSLHAALSHSPADDMFASLECWPTSTLVTFMSPKVGLRP